MSNIDLDFAVHEAICAERYKEITKRLEDGTKRMAKIEILAVLLGPGVAAEFVKSVFGL